ncbi:hypothetical protein [Streptococcus phage JX01]|nr:hypothetical protein [Streptococcus agalactiae]AFQ95907.1 hypothetical protein [Streptococcus phage LYGO9]AFQ95974.1 hypothetical protein [Streptococcus phage JX01]MBY5044622.1 hypothetical protein [Streptococcus agalactiae]MBY5059263.1 hypothetical protein [Streptococcus agalactiae]
MKTNWYKMIGYFGFYVIFMFETGYKPNHWIIACLIGLFLNFISQEKND